MAARRFRGHRQRATRFHPLAIVGICLGAAVLLTVLIGNILNLVVDDETYHRLTGKEEESSAPPPSYTANAPRVNAYPFVLGDAVEQVINSPAVAVMLNTPDKLLTYTSPVSEFYHMAGNEKVKLNDNMLELSSYVPYVIGVFTPSAFEEELADLFHAAAMQEAALMREFERSGGSEILLYGLPESTEELERIQSYVKAVKLVLPDTPVGAVIPFDAATAENWELLGSLAEIFDFCALDLTSVTLSENTDPDEKAKEVEKLLSDTAYYREQYHMRLILCETQTTLIEALEMQMYPDYAVVKMPLHPSPEPEIPEDSTETSADDLPQVNG